jgi:hypothetical protein
MTPEGELKPDESVMERIHEQIKIGLAALEPVADNIILQFFLTDFLKRGRQLFYGFFLF